MSVRRSILRYHGGKWMIARWVISHLPPHRIYVEPFGGAASVLLRKPRSYAEVYNDLESEVVNLFRVVRDDGRALARALELTPFSRDEYARSFEVSDDPLENARRLVVRSFMGFGSDATVRSRQSGFRQSANRNGTTPAGDWRNYPAALVETIERLRGVSIENRDALEILAIHDTPRTLYYCDPPYVHASRQGMHPKCYVHEMTDEEHRALGEVLHGVAGMVVLSGYRCELYDELYGDWASVDRPALADGARPRIETLWMNPAAASPPLFRGAGE